MRILRSMTAGALALSLLLSADVTAFAASREYNDYDYITSHVNLAVPQKLAITSPTQSISTSSDGYYLTGSSSADEPLYLNGDVVPNRGIYGSWGVFVPLYAGENVYTVKQGSSTASVTITKTVGSTPAQIDSITSAYPTYSSAYRAGDSITFSCVAPAGATVWVQFGEQKLELAQVATTAQAGVAAKYKLTTTVGGVAKAYNMGKLTYSMSYNGSTKTASSEGDVFLFPSSQLATIKVVDSAATTFTDKDGKKISTVVRGGAVDSVVDQTDDMFLLGMGSWVPKASVTPVLEGAVSNVIIGSSFTTSSYGERIVLKGNINPITTSWQSEDKLYLQLHHTVGVSSLSLEGSKLFTDVDTRVEGDSTVLELSIAAGKSLWGHTVEYSDDHTTTLYAKYPPTRTGSADKPLHDIIVALDAGHGGSDPGAFGIPRLTGPVEKDINYATMLATKKRLEGLGATVITTTYHDNGKSSYTDRMQAALDGKADFYLSIHSNAVAGNGLKPNGTEVYYYFNRSKRLAEVLERSIVAETGRTSRGAKNGSFRVTLNSLTPAVLIELGFVSNPQEYDRLCSKDDVFRTANAIGNSIIELIG